MKRLFKKISWKFLLQHWFAGSLLMLSAVELGGIRYHKILEYMAKNRRLLDSSIKDIKDADWKKFDQYSDGLRQVAGNENIAVILRQMSYDFLYGLGAALLIAIFVAILKRLSWLNPFLVFFSIVVLNRFGFYKSEYIKNLTFSLGDYFRYFGSEYTLMANGIFLALLGGAIYFIAWRKKLPENLVETV